MGKFKVLWLIALATGLAACSGSENTIVGQDPTGGTGGTGGSGGTGGTTASAISVSSSTPTIPSDGSASATITAFVTDASNNLLPGVVVNFTASSGGISGTPATTDATGTASVDLVTAGNSTLRTITVTASAGSLQSQVNVDVVASGGSGQVQMGNGTGAGFQAGIIGISSPSIAAGGSTSLSVSLVQSDGTLFTGSATISFNSACIGAGTAEIRQNGTPVGSVTTTTGIASVTYAAQGCAGDDVITASTTVNGDAASAMGTVTVAAASVGSIEFISATPTNIALQGTGDAGRPESSTVVFRVKDASNGPVQGADVSFSLNTTVGGLSLANTSATSGVDGTVQTIVNAGTVATSVRVSATVTSVPQMFSTQSSQLTVTTGIPTDDSFSLAVGNFNIEGWDFDGVTTDVTARLGDRFNNPVPDGTAVTFTAEGGNIGSQCTTTTTPSEGGVCTVNFRSSNPRPADGRITLLAKAIGEESFVDNNGNGAFDPAIGPTPADTFTDIAEPYRDDNEDGAYQVGEDFFDFNNDGSRTDPDLLFNGVLCNDPARCGGPSTRSAGIGEQNIVILSGAGANITQTDGSPVPAAIVMTTNSAAPLTFWIRDARDNVMAFDTTVDLAASGAGLQIVNPSSFTVPTSAIPAGAQFSGVTVFPFTVTSSTTTGSGVITLTVTSKPSDTQTVVQIGVTVTP